MGFSFTFDVFLVELVSTETGKLAFRKLLYLGVRVNESLGFTGLRYRSIFLTFVGSSLGSS